MKLVWNTVSSSKIEIQFNYEYLLVLRLTVDGLEKETDDESLTKGINFKETSTKKVIILAHVDDIPETYENVSKILSKLNIHNLYLEYQLVADLKLYNIILGLTTCSSRHACYICKSLKMKMMFGYMLSTEL